MIAMFDSFSFWMAVSIAVTFPDSLFHVKYVKGKYLVFLGHEYLVQEEFHPKCFIHIQTWSSLWDHGLLKWCYVWMKPWVLGGDECILSTGKIWIIEARGWNVVVCYQNGTQWIIPFCNDTPVRSPPSWDLLLPMGHQQM